MDKKSYSQVVTELNQRLILNALDSLEGTKTIVWYKPLMFQINAVISYQTLKDHNVVVHITPHTNPLSRDKPTDHVVFIIPPTLAATEEVVKHHLENVKTLDRKKYKIFYVPEASYVHKEKLLRAGSGWIEGKISSLPLRWFPTDHSDFVSLNMNSLPSTMLVYEDWNELYKCAKALRQLEAQMKTLPKIVFKGEWATKVLQILQQLRKSPAESEHVMECPGVDEIILIDRWLDPLTPLMRQETFAGLADEFFGIDYQVKIRFETRSFYRDPDEVPKQYKDKSHFDFYPNDEIYPLLRDDHITKASATIVENNKDLTQEKLSLSRLMAPSEGGQTSVPNLADVASRLPRFKKRRETLPLYTRMAELFYYELSLPLQKDLKKCQQDIVDNVYGEKVIPYLENAIIDCQPLVSVLRLIALQSQLCNGFRTETWNSYRKLIVQSYGINTLSWMMRLQIAGLIRCADNTDKIKSTYLPVDWQTLKKRFRLFVDDPQSEDVAKAYQGYVPLLVRILEEGELSQYRDWKSSGAEDFVRKSADKKRLLFVIGGVTRAEMGLIRKRFPDTIQCCTSAVITGDNLLQSFCD